MVDVVLTITTSIASTDGAGRVIFYPATIITSIPTAASTPNVNSTDGGGGGLTMQNKIALGIGLGVGLPSTVISVILFYIKLREIKRDNRERQQMGAGEGDVGMQVSVDHSQKKLAG